jgi:hypothetical protein
MGYVALSSKVAVGKFLKCKYPKHGRLNILKMHVGEIEKVGDGPNGKYAVVRDTKTNEYRTLRLDRMIDASVAEPVAS